MVYVSITGFRALSVWTVPRFWWHAIGSMRQAEGAPGNLSVEVRRIAGIQHTLSVWTDRAAMSAYRGTAAHLEAMRVFPKIGTGHSFGFLTDEVPDWSAVPGLWRAEGERRAAAKAARSNVV
jgi:hypothetical protein